MSPAFETRTAAPESPLEELLWRTHFLASRALLDALQKDLMDHVSMPLNHYEILSRLVESREGSLRMGELADSSQSSRSRLSHAIARLEEMGYVERAGCPRDRRGAYAVITEEGRQAYDAAHPFVERGLDRYLYSVLSSDEQKQLAAISLKLLENAVGPEISEACLSGALDPSACASGDGE